MAEGLLHSGGQLLRPGDLGDAEGGTGPDRLDEHRVSQFLRRLGDPAEIIAGMKDVAPGDPDAGQGRQLMGPVLVHAQGAGQRPAADDRDPGQFKESLYRAVLTVPAVEDREYRVEGNPSVGAVQQQQSICAPVHQRGAGRAVCRLLPGAVLQSGEAAGATEPPPLPGDAHSQRDIAGGVHVGQHRIGGMERNFVLRGAAAEENENGFHGIDLLNKINRLVLIRKSYQNQAFYTCLSPNGCLVSFLRNSCDFLTALLHGLTGGRW